MSNLPDFQPLDVEALGTGGSGTQSPLDPSASTSRSSSTSTAELVSTSAPVSIPIPQNKNGDHLNIGQHGEIMMTAIPVSDEFDTNTIFGSFAMTQSLRSDPDVALGAPRGVQRAISTSPRIEHGRPQVDFGEDDGEGHFNDRSPTVEDPFFPFLNPDLDGDMVASSAEVSRPDVFASAATRDAVARQPGSVAAEGGKKKRWMISKGLSEADIGPYYKNSLHGTRMTATSSASKMQQDGRAGIPIPNANPNSRPLLSRHLSRQSSKGLRRKSSISSNLSFVGNYVFGSTIFNSPARSQTSMGSEKVNIVMDSLGIYPSMMSLTSTDMTTLPFEEELVVPLSSSHPRSVSAYSSRQNSRFDLQQEGAERRKGYIRSISNVSKGSSVSLSTRLSGKDAEEKTSLRDEDEASDKLTDVKPITRLTAVPKKQWQQTMPDLVEGPESDTLTVQSTIRKNLAAAALAISMSAAMKTMPDKKKPSLLGEKEEEEGEESDKEDAEVKVVTPATYKKNLYILCTVFFFSFAAYMSLRNLQSSLNDSDGLGMYSLSCIYAFLFIGSFFTTTIVQRLRPKFSMLLSLVGMLVYIVSNFYPQYYTLMPASCLVGFCLAIMWTAQATYMANNAASYAAATGQRLQDCYSGFHGIFFASFQVSQMVGGAISSVIFSMQKPQPEVDGAETLVSYLPLPGNETFHGNETVFEVSDNLETVMPPSTTTPSLVKTVSSWIANESPALILESFNMSFQDFNTTINSTLKSTLLQANSTLVKRCGMLNCPGQATSELKADFDMSMYYIMVGVFLFSLILSLIILLFFLDPLEGSMKNPRAGIATQLTSVFKMIAEPNMICLLPLMAYTLLQTTFVFGEFNKSFVTCNLGIHMIGYLTVCLSLFSSVFAYVTGRLQKFIGQNILILSGLLFHLSVLTSFWIWNPSREQPVMFFVLGAIWGAGDGMITTQIVSLLGILFSSNKEAAFSTYKMTQSFSAFILFVTGPYLCTKTKVTILMVIASLAVVGYISLKVRLRLVNKKTQQNQQLPTSIVDVSIDITKGKP